VRSEPNHRFLLTSGTVSDSDTSKKSPAPEKRGCHPTLEHTATVPEWNTGMPTFLSLIVILMMGVVFVLWALWVTKFGLPQI
jgi:hypothetical protein